MRRGVSRARRVRRRVQHHPFRLRRDRFGELLRRDAKPVRLRRLNDHRRRAAKLHDLRIADPIGRGDHHLVARVQRRHERVEDDRLAAGRDQRLRGLVVEPVLAFELLADRLAEFGNALDRGVARLVALDRAERRLLDVVGRREVGLARAKPDDVAPGRDQIARLLRHGDRGRRFDPPQRLRQKSCRQRRRAAHHFVHSRNETDI